MSKGPFVEDCFSITPTYKVDFDRMRKIGIHIEYHMEAEDHILVTVGSNNEPQRIDTEDVESTSTSRRYFHCPGCDKLVYKLYLLPNGTEFKCRKCHSLKYTLSALNKKTPHGKMLYSMNRMDKLSKQRESMGTILYKGNYTKKFQRILRISTRVGYTKVVEDAKVLMTALKNFQGA